MEKDEEDVEESLTHKLTSRVDVTWLFDRAIRMPFFEGKITQLCELIKWTIFIVGISKFGIVYFKRYIFILCGKFFLLHGHFKKIPIICIFKHFLSITVANFQDSIPLLYRQNYLADNHGRDFHFLYLPVRFSFSLLSKQNYLADDYRRHFRAFIILTE